jgi:hypothetical protein
MRAPVVVAAASLVVAACSSSSSPPDEGPPVPIGWVKGAAEAANGPAPEVDLVDACGSDSATWLAELATVPPFAAKVQYHWGDCVEGGKQVMAAGTIATTHLGPTDTPMDHPYGDDLSMDVNLDPAFVPFAKHLGKGPAETGATELHVELSGGMIPHLPRPPSPSTGQSYRASADLILDRSTFQPGFAEPPIGDRAVLMGRWIIDCGHDNFDAELHALSFVGWAHVDGAKTTARFYYNPYRDTEQYALTVDKLGAVNDPSRLGDTQTFPKQLVREVLALDNGTIDRLRAFENVEATRTPPADFRVCAPEGSQGALVVQSDIVVRPGVTLTLTPSDSTGCVTVHVAFDAYVPMDAAIRTCALPWSYLDEIVKAEVGGSLDVLGQIQANISSADGKARAALDPVCSCADALAGPPVTDAPATQSTRTDGTQPFPFYGVLTVERR